MKKLSILLCILYLICLPISAYSISYQIGHKSFTYYDTDRYNREIPSEIYYPSETNGEDTPISDSASGFPVISFGHGRSMDWDAYENIWEVLVPLGYIVIFAITETSFMPDAEEFGLDIAFLANQILLDGIDSTTFFYNKVASKSALMGHSMGAATSFLGAAEVTKNDSIVAIVSFASGNTVPSPVDAASEINIPVLLFGGSDDYMTPLDEFQIPIYDALNSDCKTLISINGANHCQYADYNYNCDNYEDTFPEAELTREEQHILANRFLIPWLDFHLKDDISAWCEFEDSLMTSNTITYMHTCDVTTIEEIEGLNKLDIPIKYDLYNYPNPFNPMTTISYQLPKAGQIKLLIYNMMGQLIKILIDEYKEAGHYMVVWDGKDNNAESISNGVYFYQLITSDYQSTKKMMIIK